jgi:hypothetical protein
MGIPARFRWRVAVATAVAAMAVVGDEVRNGLEVDGMVGNEIQVVGGACGIPSARRGPPWPEIKVIPP